MRSQLSVTLGRTMGYAPRTAAEGETATRITTRCFFCQKYLTSRSSAFQAYIVSIVSTVSASVVSAPCKPPHIAAERNACATASMPVKVTLLQTTMKVRQTVQVSGGEKCGHVVYTSAGIFHQCASPAYHGHTWLR